MKKLNLGLLFVVLMAASLVSGSATSAIANDRCPDTGCIKTLTTAKAWSPAPHKIKVKYSVRTQAGAVPEGTVRVIVRGNGTFRAKNRAYPGSSHIAFVGVPSNRSYDVDVKFIPGQYTEFRRSHMEAVVTVQ